MFTWYLGLGKRFLRTLLLFGDSVVVTSISASESLENETQNLKVVEKSLNLYNV